MPFGIPWATSQPSPCDHERLFTYIAATMLLNRRLASQLNSSSLAIAHMHAVPPRALVPTFHNGEISWLMAWFPTFRPWNLIYFGPFTATMDPLAEYSTLCAGSIAPLTPIPGSTLPPIPIPGGPKPIGVTPRVARALYARKNAVFNFMDSDRNDMVTFREFCKGVAFAGVRPLPDKAELVWLFETLDVNADGRVSFVEFKSALDKLQPPPPRRRQIRAPPRPPPLPYAGQLNALRSEVTGATDQAAIVEHGIRTLAEITGGSKVCTCKQMRETLIAVGMMMSKRDFVAMLRRYDPDGTNRVRYEHALRDAANGLCPKAPLTHRPMRAAARPVVYHQHQLGCQTSRHHYSYE